MKCVLCNGKSVVKETRYQIKGYVRFRQCLSCSNRFSTLEVFHTQDEKQEPKEIKLKPMNLVDVWR
jgi:transcriptional regulator NrdR family protein